MGSAVKGYLDPVVLAVLSAGPLHGYAVIEELKARSGGELDLPEGTVYPALHRLERRGLLKRGWAEAGGRPRPGDPPAAGGRPGGGAREQGGGGVGPRG